LSHLFVSAGIIAVVPIAVVYAMARNRSVLPVAARAVVVGVAGCTWRRSLPIPPPCEVKTDAVLRQPLRSGASSLKLHRRHPGGAASEELDDYRRFVLTLASKVAAAHREDGQSVSPAEAETIREITSVLGAAGS
jgi:hypothetical protein